MSMNIFKSSKAELDRDWNQRLEAASAQNMTSHAIDARWYQNATGIGAAPAGIMNSMVPNKVWEAAGTSSQTSRPALGGFTVHKAYNGFTVTTNGGDIILCPEIKDVGEQIVAYLIANKLEK